MKSADGHFFFSMGADRKGACYEVKNSITFDKKWETQIDWYADDPDNLHLSRDGRNLVFVPEVIGGKNQSESVVLWMFSEGRLTKKFSLAELFDLSRDIPRLPLTPEVLIVKAAHGTRLIRMSEARVLLSRLRDEELLFLEGRNEQEELFLFDTSQGERFLIDPAVGRIVYRGRIDAKGGVVTDQEAYGSKSVNE